jgi:5-methylcytosine-specific restriction endonuclease McrA
MNVSVQRRGRKRRNTYRPPFSANVDWEALKSARHPRWYQAYLCSNHWLTVRQARLYLDKYRCRRCGEDKYLQVHHKTYERLGHEDMADLETLCRTCHRREHGKARA